MIGSALPDAARQWFSAIKTLSSRQSCFFSIRAMVIWPQIGICGKVFHAANRDEKYHNKYLSIMTRLRNDRAEKWPDKMLDKITNTSPCATKTLDGYPVKVSGNFLSIKRCNLSGKMHGKFSANVNKKRRPLKKAFSMSD